MFFIFSQFQMLVLLASLYHSFLSSQIRVWYCSIFFFSFFILLLRQNHLQPDKFSVGCLRPSDPIALLRYCVHIEFQNPEVPWSLYFAGKSLVCVHTICLHRWIQIYNKTQRKWLYFTWLGDVKESDIVLIEFKRLEH